MRTSHLRELLEQQIIIRPDHLTRLVAFIAKQAEQPFTEMPEWGQLARFWAQRLGGDTAAGERLAGRWLAIMRLIPQMLALRHAYIDDRIAAERGDWLAIGTAVADALEADVLLREMAAIRTAVFSHPSVEEETP